MRQVAPGSGHPSWPWPGRDRGEQVGTEVALPDSVQRSAPASVDVVLEQLLSLFGEASGVSEGVIPALGPGLALLLLRREPNTRLPRALREALQERVRALALPTGASLEVLEAALLEHDRARPQWAAPMALIRMMVGEPPPGPPTAEQRAAVARALFGVVRG